MSKARETRDRIIQKAAELFNLQGYAGSSMSDIMRVTGLKKGGIYNHFKSKDDLALEAFDFAVSRVQQAFSGALKGKRHAVDRLHVVIAVFERMAEDPPVKGGCPLLNTAIESDDTHPVLRERAQQVMDSWRTLICRILEKGIARGEIRATVEVDTVATIIIATMEGAVMMSKLYGDTIHVKRALAYLTEYIDHQLT